MSLCDLGGSSSWFLFVGWYPLPNFSDVVWDQKIATKLYRVSKTLTFFFSFLSMSLTKVWLVEIFIKRLQNWCIV